MAENPEQRLYGLLEGAVLETEMNIEEHRKILLCSEIDEPDKDWGFSYLKSATLGIFAVRGCPQVRGIVYDENVVDRYVSRQHVLDHLDIGLRRVAKMNRFVEKMPVKIARSIFDNEAIYPESDDEAKLLVGVESHIGIGEDRFRIQFVYHREFGSVAEEVKKELIESSSKMAVAKHCREFPVARGITNLAANSVTMIGRDAAQLLLPQRLEEF